MEKSRNPCSMGSIDRTLQNKRNIKSGRFRAHIVQTSRPWGRQRGRSDVLRRRSPLSFMAVAGDRWPCARRASGAGGGDGRPQGAARLEAEMMSPDLPTVATTLWPLAIGWPRLSVRRAMPRRIVEVGRRLGQLQLFPLGRRASGVRRAQVVGRRGQGDRPRPLIADFVAGRAE